MSFEKRQELADRPDGANTKPELSASQKQPTAGTDLSTSQKQTMTEPSQQGALPTEQIPPTKTDLSSSQRHPNPAGPDGTLPLEPENQA